MFFRMAEKESVFMPKKQPWRIAAYMRLSKENHDGGEAESSSISTQRMIIERFASEHFSDYQLEEYIEM